SDPFPKQLRTFGEIPAVGDLQPHMHDVALSPLEHLGVQGSPVKVLQLPFQLQRRRMGYRSALKHAGQQRRLRHRLRCQFLLNHGRDGRGFKLFRRTDVNADISHRSRLKGHLSHTEPSLSKEDDTSFHYRPTQRGAKRWTPLFSLPVISPPPAILYDGPFNRGGIILAIFIPGDYRPGPGRKPSAAHRSPNPLASAGTTGRSIEGRGAPRRRFLDAGSPERAAPGRSAEGDSLPHPPRLLLGRHG